MRFAMILLAAATTVACTDQTPVGNDGGSDVKTMDVSTPDSGTDAEGGPHTCIFDTDNFDNGCVFGP